MVGRQRHRHVLGCSQPGVLKIIHGQLQLWKKGGMERAGIGRQVRTRAGHEDEAGDQLRKSSEGESSRHQSCSIRCQMTASAPPTISILQRLADHVKRSVKITLSQGDLQQHSTPAGRPSRFSTSPVLACANRARAAVWGDHCCRVATTVAVGRPLLPCADKLQTCTHHQLLSAECHVLQAGRRSKGS